jgi:hypothetical protein
MRSPILLLQLSILRGHHPCQKYVVLPLVLPPLRSERSNREYLWNFSRIPVLQGHSSIAAKATSLSLQFTTRLGALQSVLVGTFGY